MKNHWNWFKNGFTVKNEGGLKEIIRHLEDKILNLPNLLYYDISKRIAEKRKKIIYEFYEEILNEYKLRNYLWYKMVPQIVKGGKYVFGWSKVGEKGEIT